MRPGRPEYSSRLGIPPLNFCLRIVQISCRMKDLFPPGSFGECSRKADPPNAGVVTILSLSLLWAQLSPTYFISMVRMTTPWAAMIRKLYEADPLLFPDRGECHSSMNSSNARLGPRGT